MTVLPVESKCSAGSDLYRAQAVRMEIEERLRLARKAHHTRCDNGWRSDGYVESVGQLIDRLSADRTAWAEIERLLKNITNMPHFPTKQQTLSNKTITYYGRKGPRATRTDCCAKTIGELTAYVSFETIIAFRNARGIVYERAGALSSRTSQHKHRFRRFAYADDKAIPLQPMDFWKQMAYDGVLDAFQYNGTGYDPPPK